ncbi:toll/interleukin-1 receptor domain-containing protein [Paenibacillus donghaensis]|uniref:TIR domain-containing protein n=1 Tax=Paenibacillus donghaensis TaxID=414771 RepID=A0A2Z2KPI9_9BACL|nr:toll/interleukin-1 receptor domain-containing protein [Paenibacillus donghaensis]ASA25660.1 hypothetical protein B9T62_35980 [Paenibacillus donghaensis]
MPKIFISHAVKDAELVIRPFIDMLVMGLGVDREEIYFTSGGDIPTGANFPEHIKTNINSAELVIMILTENYMDSDFCLNEMGAAWANNQNIYPIVIPPTSYKILDRSALRGVTNVLMATEDDLPKLRDELEGKNLNGRIRSGEYRTRGKQFLESIEKYNEQRQKEGPFSVPVKVFSKLQNQLKELEVELEEKIDECDAKDDLIEELKKLKDQTAVKHVIRSHNTDESEELQELIDDTKSSLDQLDSIMVSLIFHYRYFSHNYTPAPMDGWSAIHKLAARKFIDQDGNKITINYGHPLVRKADKVLNILSDALEGMSPEVSEQFEEEFGLAPDLSNIDFWQKVLRIRGMELSY